MIYIIQNNQVALGTRLHEYHAAEGFTGVANMYGVQSAAFDGNHVLDAYAATRWAAERCRGGEGPILLTSETFRMGGHATHDEAEARELFRPDVFDHWGRRDPIGCYETWLVEGSVDLKTGESLEEGAAVERNRAVLDEIESAVTAEVESAADEALAGRANMPAREGVTDDVYGEWPDTEYPGPAPFER